MKKLKQKTSVLLVKRIGFFWVLLTLVCLLLGLYVNWQLGVNTASQNISAITKNLGDNTDKFIEDLFQEVYTLPLTTSPLDCDKQIKPKLVRIYLNNANITGIILSHKNKIVCSTLKNTKGLTLSNTYSRTILGPFNLPIFDRPIYIFQRKIGAYEVGVIVHVSIVENKLYPPTDQIGTIALYHVYDKKNILKMKYNGYAESWLLNNSPDFLIKTPDNAPAFYRLISVQGINLVALEDPVVLSHYLLLRELLFSVIFLIISFLLYLFIRKSITNRSSPLGLMKLAVKNKEFYPAYQPVFDNVSGHFTGAEVLVRWKSNQDKVIMPDFFISEAERSGLIIPITLQIIETAFMEFQRVFKDYPHFHLAINLSALHFTDLQFFDDFYLLQKRYKVLASQIIFEITERDLLDKNNAIFSTKMQLLRKAGFSLAVDDYGTGHASISYLQHFPFNYLKIDKLFIQAIGTKALTESLNAAIINMAKSLNLMIIAEGIETEEQRNYLSKNGVQFLQGWYFSKAISIEELTELLKGDKNEE